MKGDKNALNAATFRWLILLTVLEFENIFYLYLILVPSLKKGHTGNTGYSELGKNGQLLAGDQNSAL